MTHYLVRVYDQSRTYAVDVLKDGDRIDACASLWNMVYDRLAAFGKLDTKAAHTARANVDSIDDRTVKRTFTISDTGYIASFERLPTA